MRKEYDFTFAKRAKDVPQLAKLQAERAGMTLITIYLENAILEALRLRAEQEGKGYQTLINESLAASLAQNDTQ